MLRSKNPGIKIMTIDHAWFFNSNMTKVLILCDYDFVVVTIFGRVEIDASAAKW